MSGEVMMREPRAVMFGEFLNHIRKSRDSQYPELFASNENWRMEAMEDACRSLHKEYADGGDNDWRQIPIELGYYVRYSSPFSISSQYTQYNAISCGELSTFLAHMCLSAIGDKLKDADWDLDNDLIIRDFEDEELPSLRSIISIGESVFNIESDFYNIINMGRKQVQDHILNDDSICAASWYWESVGEDLLKHNAMIGTESFDEESDGVSKCNEYEYLEEWYWDILSGQYAWNELDWMLVGEWGCNDKTLQHMVEEVIKRQMGKDIKNDFFPDDEDIDSWRSDNA